MGVLTDNCCNPVKNKEMQGRVRSHHQTAIGWLKNCGVLT
jgi:hypothetical protein